MELEKKKIILGLIILFVSLTYLVQYNMNNIKTDIYANCPDGTKEKINKTQIFICGNIPNPRNENWKMNISFPVNMTIKPELIEW